MNKHSIAQSLRLSILHLHSPAGLTGLFPTAKGVEGMMVCHLLLPAHCRHK